VFGSGESMAAVCNSSNSHVRPKTPEELFNLRHAQARNIVERIFGILKRRWALFNRAPEYPIQTQAMLVAAIAALHNFIRIHDGEDNADSLGPESDGSQRVGAESSSLDAFVDLEPREIAPEELGMYISEEEKVRAAARRDRIKDQMWADYVEYLAAHPEIRNT
jgi:hypothetical protein